MKKVDRHDSLVLNLEKRLLSSGWRTFTFREYHTPRAAGEIDLYATKGNYRVVFEVKCSNRPKSYRYGKKQLKRADEHYFSNSKRSFYFIAHYVSPKRDDYKVDWIRQ